MPIIPYQSNNMKVLYVSIGNQCSPGHLLRGKKLRKVAFPFDWSVNPLESIITLIYTDFSDYDLKKENLIIGDYQCDNLIFNEKGFPLKQSNYQVFFPKFNIFYPHDYFDLDDKTFREVDKKYRRRSRRLLKALKKSRNACFVYSNKNTDNVINAYCKHLGFNPLNLDDKKNIQNFKEMISQKYPHLLFSVVNCEFQDI